jgi:membrane-bound lytic murein transglycosylase B
VALGVGLWLVSLAPSNFSLAETPSESKTSPAGRPELKLFIDEMADKHGFALSELEDIFTQARFRSDIIEAISKPAEAKPWYEYRSIFINDARIAKGRQFMVKNAEALMLARRAYGVPEELTTAILGVETGYGKRTGRFRVIDALTTLAFNYPKRAALFRQELEQYLLLTREEDIAPLKMKGSYAGAMGIAQFMPTSYRRYAVDFDGDGRKDLTRSTIDAIGSVANYFKAHGWKPMEPIAVRAAVSGELALRLRGKNGLTRRRVDAWRRVGVRPLGNDIPGSRKAMLIALKGKGGSEYWLGFDNFYVITRYNKSTNYAMAVYQLSLEIESLPTASLRTGK